MINILFKLYKSNFNFCFSVNNYFFFYYLILLTFFNLYLITFIIKKIKMLHFYFENNKYFIQFPNFNCLTQSILEEIEIE